MKNLAKIYANPYKTRLWLSNLDHGLLNDDQKRLFYHCLGWGRKGCGDWNYQLQALLHRSKRTIQYYLRHLEKHCLIDIRGAYGKHRRIIAIAWPTKQVWMTESLRQNLKKMGAKNCTHQRRTMKHSINQQLDNLLYRNADSLPNKVSPKAGDESISGVAPPNPRFATGRKLTPMQNLARRKLIDMFLNLDYPRDRAIRLADVRLEEQIRRSERT